MGNLLCKLFIKVQNQSLRYATHQAKKRMGMVAIRPHQIGSRRSAMIPRTVKIIQKIFRSTKSL